MAHMLRSNSKSNKAPEDLEEAPRVPVGCQLCGSSRSRLVCSAEDIAEQQEFLHRYYRTRWSQQTSATATDRVSFTQDYITAIVSCTDCGLLYRNPRPRAAAVTKAYAKEQYEDAYMAAEFETQRAWARSKIPEFDAYLRKQKRQTRPRILEIGSFVGGFLMEGRDRGWDMLGVDPGRDVASFCRRHGLEVLEGTLEEVKLPPASFDAVVVWNTFDQLPHPHQFLEQAVALLRQGGLLVLRVPNGACFEEAMGLRARLPATLRQPLDVALACNNLLTFPYLYGYSPRQLQRLTDALGFQTLGCHFDQVVSTPPGQLRWWGLLEERTIKALCRLIAVVWTDRASRRYRSSPWLDCYFERACSENEGLMTEKIGLGVVPVYSP